MNKENTNNIMQALAARSKKNYERVSCKMRIASQIAEAMESAGLSKKQFADLMHQKPSVITKWLSGTHNFTVDTLAEISSQLGVDIIETTRPKGEYMIEESNYLTLSRGASLPVGVGGTVVKPVTSNVEELSVSSEQTITNFVHYGYC